MTSPQTSSATATTATTSTMHLHCPAPRRPIALVRKQHQLHSHSHHHPYTFRSNTSDYSSSSRNSNTNNNGGNVSRGSLRRSTSPISSKSRRGSAVRNDDVQFDPDENENQIQNGKEREINFLKEVASGLVGRQRDSTIEIDNTTSNPTSNPTSSTSTFDKDRTPTRKEMASISNSHSSSSSTNLTPTGNHNRIDLQVQKPSPININQKDSFSSSNHHHHDGISIDSTDLSSTRSLMESPSSLSLKSTSPSLSIDHVDDHHHHGSTHNFSHHHSNSNASSILSTSSQSSSSSNHLSPYLTSTSTFTSSSSSMRSNPGGVPIIPPSPISRNQTRNPFARHFSKTIDPLPSQSQSLQHLQSNEIGGGLGLDSDLPLPSPNGKRALFLEQQEEEEELSSLNLHRGSTDQSGLGDGFNNKNEDGGSKRNDEISGYSTTRKHLGGNRHKLSKSEEIKNGLIGLELGLDGDGDEVMKE